MNPYSRFIEFGDPTDFAFGNAGEAVRAAYTKCDGVFGAASGTRSYRSDLFDSTITVSAAAGKLEIRENARSHTFAPDNACGAGCKFDDITYVKTHTYDIETGKLTLHHVTERKFQAVRDDGTVIDASARDEGTGTSRLTIPAVRPAVFPMTVTSTITAERATAAATFQPRPQDAGANASVYVFAVAPANVARGASLAKDARIGWIAQPTSKADPVPCVIAQLNASGQLQATSAANLQALVTGVLNAQGQSVSIMNNVPTPNVAGATFYVGYGPNATAMIDGGINRSAVTVPGALVCQPAPPQTGWWWNPAEDGRGFSIEVRGNNIFFASFLYDVSGRSTWHVSTGPVSLDGSLYKGDLLGAKNGQTLGGAYPGRPAIGVEGPITLAFNSDSQGTMVWPGGAVPIQRFNIVPNGLTAPAAPNTPESGWWWNEEESGRGFFMEWQAGTLDIAGYMYDEAGNPVWYLNVGERTAPGGNVYSGSWWSYGNGQTLTGAWKPNARLSTTVAPLTITFSAPDTALMTLPNGRTTRLTRHRF